MKQRVEGKPFALPCTLPLKAATARSDKASHHGVTPLLGRHIQRATRTSRANVCDTRGLCAGACAKLWKTSDACGIFTAVRKPHLRCCLLYKRTNLPALHPEVQCRHTNDATTGRRRTRDKSVRMPVKSATEGDSATAHPQASTPLREGAMSVARAMPKLNSKDSTRPARGAYQAGAKHSTATTTLGRGVYNRWCTLVEWRDALICQKRRLCSSLTALALSYSRVGLTIW
jgi:hypothetical protein